jgi:hypothetical protein
MDAAEVNVSHIIIKLFCSDVVPRPPCWNETYGYMQQDRGRLSICRIAPNQGWQVSLTAKFWGKVRRFARQGLDHRRRELLVYHLQ